MYLILFVFFFFFFFFFNQRSTTGLTKAVVCVILSVGWCI